MKPFPFISSIMALSLSISAPEALAHVHLIAEIRAKSSCLPKSLVVQEIPRASQIYDLSGLELNNKNVMRILA